jgi:hypothetical protein
MGIHRAFLDKPSPWKAFGCANRITPKLHSKRRKRILSQWIRNCEGNHHRCERPDSVIPCRRVFDLGTNPRNGIKLIDTEGMQARFAIACFIWTAVRNGHPGTTKSNLAAMQAGVHWRDIPPALQDAAIVASEQGIRYLWLQPLCCVQDDPEDLIWHDNHRDSILRESYLTIALPSIRSPSEHVFKQRTSSFSTERHSRTVEIPLSKYGKQYKIIAREHHYMTHLIFGDRSRLTRSHSEPFSHTDIASVTTPLLQKCWFCQYRLLSRRVVYFHCAEMLWECCGGLECECGWMDGSHSDTIGLRRCLNSDGDKQYPPGWSLVSSHFQQFAGTNPMERVLQISTLARRWHKVTNNSYLAGIFASSREDLAYQLCWGLFETSRDLLGPIVPSRDRTGSAWRLHDPLLPSWSWISMVTIKGTLMNAYYLGSPRAKFIEDARFDVVDISYKPLPGRLEDEFSASCWSLTVNARVVIGKICFHRRLYKSFQFFLANRTGEHPASAEPLPTSPYLKRHLDGMFLPDCDRWAERQDLRGRRDQASFDSLSGMSDSSEWCYGYFLLLGTIYCPQSIVRYSNGSEDLPVDALDTGMVLQRSPSRHPGKANGMERIGIFTVPSELNYFANSELQEVRLV